MKSSIFLLLMLLLSFQSKAQPVNCTFKKPVIIIDFGSGNINDVNTVVPADYVRIRSSCPSDGYYTYTNYTSECFRGDWFTTEDHTPDASGNMLLVNSSYNTGVFFTTIVTGLKGGTTYEFGVWLMNVCKITDKCPFPLLPNITIRLQTGTGKTIAQFGTGEVIRHPVPHWTQHRAVFTTPASETSLTITMINHKPGGCGNDFAMDDITFRECVKSPPVSVVKPAPKKNIVTKVQPAIVKQAPKKATPVPPKKQQPSVKIVKRQKDSPVYSAPVVKPRTLNFPPPPSILRTRENTLIKKIETEAGEIKISLYDNGEIDGDTISIYHNNVLLLPHARLSGKPISISIAVDSSHPHHELIMVAENLGSIPPNTSLMVVTAGSRRYEVFISSTEQRNAKVILDLKE